MPAAENILFVRFVRLCGFLRGAERGTADRSAVNDRTEIVYFRPAGSIDRKMCNAAECRRRPFCIQDNVMRGHARAGPGELRSVEARLRGIPAAELEVFIYAARPCGFVVIPLDLRFIADAGDRIRRGSVDKGQVVIAAQIKQRCIVICFLPSFFPMIREIGHVAVALYEPGDRVIIFIICQEQSVGASRGGPGFIVGNTVAYDRFRPCRRGRSCSVKRFKVVIPDIQRSTPLFCSHRQVAARHFFKKRIIVTCNTGLPVISVVRQVLDRGFFPDLRDVFVIFMGAAVKRLISVYERQCKRFACKIDVYDRRAVAADCLSGRIRTRIEIVPVIGIQILRGHLLPSNRDRRPRRSGFCSQFFKRISAVVRVFNPIHELVRRIRIRCPGSAQRYIGAWNVSPIDPLGGPAGKDIPDTRRFLREIILIQRRIRIDMHGCNIRTAVGFKRNPYDVLYNRVKTDVRPIDGHGVADICGTTHGKRPTDQRFVGCQFQRSDIRGRHLIVFIRHPCFDNRGTGFIIEKHVIGRFKFRRQIDEPCGFDCLYAKGGKAYVVSVEPSGKAHTVLGRRNRRFVERIARSNYLLIAPLSAVHVKRIGPQRCVVRYDPAFRSRRQLRFGRFGEQRGQLDIGGHSR